MEAAGRGVVAAGLGNDDANRGAEVNSPSQPRPKVVLLGASNLARGISSAIQGSREILGEPLDLFAAIGHGRSYGLTETRVLGRSLPGILRSGIWEALDSNPAGPTFALLTDIGNDILYGVPVDEAASWIEECLIRLKRDSVRIVLTELPLESSARLARWQFSILRSIIFPSSSLRFEDALSRGAKLNEAIVELAARHDVHLLRPQLHWYGFDPIHVRSRVFPQVWRCFFSTWIDEEPQVARPYSMPRRVSAYHLRPEKRRLFGVDQHHSQPFRTLDDGTTLSFF